MAEKDLNQAFLGSPTTVISTTADIADAGFAVATTNATLTELDNTTNPAPRARATLNVPGWDTVAPTANSGVDLFVIPQDLGGGTGDVTPPTTTDKKGARFVGTFPIYDTDEAQEQQIMISLEGIGKAKFSIQNNTGTSLDFSDGATTVKIEKVTSRPEPAP